MINRINLSFRLPEEMHADLTVWAKQEERSLHNLILWILKQAISAHNKGDLT